jgi:hypothetical protein
MLSEKEPPTTVKMGTTTLSKLDVCDRVYRPRRFTGGATEELAPIAEQMAQLCVKKMATAENRQVTPG